ncbi:hypothetical protein MKK67_23775 [Methylobacterium sp. J-072]|uniref:hypothetical protein n=1 Tax=Methylobacterium sp. J-072 TaxID=2836651 RepID=UPI001FBB78C4|nr:hypothetical protein [Methylobacterium sp. J-072]MCJ2095494.1 hypothetical protein [Methylobacterium sp. J-072]
MPAERTVLLVFADATEHATFNRLLAERPELQGFVQGQIEAVIESFVPRMHAGAWGLTVGEIDRAIAVTCADADWRNATAPKAQRLDDDERLMCRLAYQAACRSARNDFLAALSEHEPAAKALIALAAYGRAVADGMDTLRAAMPPHALAAQPPAHRRLRPEDFGALPQGRRSASMPWADRVRRTADHPSRGVGRIHGTGEPPAADV